MIKISLDEAYCYDLFSIMIVKLQQNGDRKNLNNCQKLEKEIADQVGTDLHTKICKSNEFILLLNTNFKIYEHIETIKKRKNAEDAITTDNLNYQRFVLKCELQKKFFPNNPINETKIGYDLDKPPEMMTVDTHVE